MIQQQVELHPAHVWDCPECGSENFCRCVTYLLSEEEVVQLRQEGTITGNEIGAWVSTPDKVTCRCCGTEFKVVDMLEDEWLT